jgi:hypothetical protein
MLALGGLELLVAMAPADIPRLHAVAIDSGVVVFAAHELGTLTLNHL